MDAIRLELDRSDRIYRTGDVVSGMVVVTGPSAARAQRIVLRTYWATRGKGGITRGGKRAVVLHEGPLPGGGIHRLPFRFEAPEGPFTYRGHLMSVDHHLEAVLDIPLAPDVRSETVFVLAPGAQVASVPDWLAPDAPSVDTPPKRRSGATFGAILVGVGVILLPLPGLILMLVGAVLLAGALRNEIAATRTGRITTEVAPQAAAPGEPVEVRVGILPPKPADVSAVTATLEAREVCVSGSGNNRKTHRHLAHSDTVVLLGPTTMAGGILQEAVGAVRVPIDAPWSFKAQNNEVRWEVVVRVEIPSWPDWSAHVPLVVWPAAGLGRGARDAGAVAARAASQEALEAARADARRLADPGGRGAKEAAEEPAAPTAPAAPAHRGEGGEGLGEGGGVVRRGEAAPEPPAPAAERPAARSRPLGPRPTSPTADGTTAESEAPLPRRSVSPSAPTPSPGPGRTRRSAAPRAADSADPAGGPSIRAGAHPPGRASVGSSGGAAAGTTGGGSAVATGSTTDGASAATTGRASAGSRVDDLAAAVEAILAAPRLAGERERLTEALVGRSVETVVIVNRVERPFGRIRTPGYEHGRIVRGTLAGSRREVEVHVPASRAEVADGLRRRDEFTVSGVVRAWERLPDRPVIRIPE